MQGLLCLDWARALIELVERPANTDLSLKGLGLQRVLRAECVGGVSVICSFVGRRFFLDLQEEGLEVWKVQRRGSACTLFLNLSFSS